MRLLHSVLLIGLLVLAGCGNPYAKFYQPAPDAESLAAYVTPGQQSDPVIVNAGDNWDEAYKALLRKGLRPLGYSSFEAADVGSDGMLTQAKAVGATNVLIGVQYKKTVSGSVPLTLPSTSTTMHSGSVYGNGGYGSYSGTSTTYGTNTTYIPYNTDRYAYSVAYFVAGPKPKLGIYFENTSPEQRSAIGSNSGVQITLVIENTPAFTNDLFEGDILVALDGVKIENMESFSALLSEKKAGAEIELDLRRDDSTVKKTFKLAAN